MDLIEYHNVIAKSSFVEFPESISGETRLVEQVINYSSCDLELKTYLAEMILKRCFSPTNSCLGNDIDWFINGFGSDFQSDLIEPWRTPAIQKAIDMIMSKNVFTNGVIATTYMFGIVEFYTKYLLGWRHHERDFFDNKYHESFRSMDIGAAFIKLKKQKTGIAESLNRIDKYNIRLLKENFIAEERFIKARIADRLTIARNTMLHGENHSFYDISHYLVMLYALFHLHHLQSK